jgi:AraC family transcriptional regulator, regulatory protein of adaptative response / methylated-DNA-[protein]-cysteine methyltransferase
MQVAVGGRIAIMINTMPSVKEMKQAYLQKDPSYDGIFFLGVRTTGIFCRPSCPARKPLPENVNYFSSVREAVFAGYRPCKRCRPLDTDGRPPDWVGQLLNFVDKKEERIRDSEVRQFGIDPFRVRRYFQKHYGMTFQAYCRARRMGDALDQLRRGASLDDVALGNGYESHSGFRDAFTRTFGRPPGTSRDTDCIVVTWIESPLGPIVAAANDDGVCLLEFTDRRMLETQFRTLRKVFSSAIVPGENSHLNQLQKELREYFAGSLREFSVPLLYPGTPFQSRVWNELLRIPYGETRSYEDLARRLGSSGAQRAVGHANGSNRIAIVIPCHRVVNKDGKLGGYGGGLWRKQFLLDLEKGKRRLLD